MRSATRFLASMLVLCVGTTAFGQDLFSFTYSDLDGDFDATTSLFTAADDGNTDGEVTRIFAPTGDAFFAGTLGAGEIPGAASFLLQTELTNITPAGADIVPGTGLLVIHDVDDGTITADVDGQWLNVGGSANFVGLLSNVAISSGDGTFDGTDGSSFSSVFPVPPPFEGNIINLTFGGWFLGLQGPADFNDKTTLTSGVVVPEPATLSLLALGGIACLARRRKK